MVRLIDRFIFFSMIILGLFILSVNQSFSDSGAEYIIIKTTVPPVIDGKLNDIIWKFTEPAKIALTNAKGVPCKKQSLAYAVYDNANFYVGFHRLDKDLGKIAAVFKNRDSNVWEDDEFELFIDVDHDHKTYWQIAVNTNNAIWDCYNSGGGCNGGDNINCETAVSLGAKEDWFAEIKVALKDLDVKEVPKQGTIWGINFAGHVKTGIDEWVTWSDIGPSFHVPTGFGNGIFSSKTANISRLGKLPYLWGCIKSDE